MIKKVNEEITRLNIELKEKDDDLNNRLREIKDLEAKRIEHERAIPKLRLEIMKLRTSLQREHRDLEENTKNLATNLKEHAGRTLPIR